MNLSDVAIGYRNKEFLKNNNNNIYHYIYRVIVLYADSIHAIIIQVFSIVIKLCRNLVFRNKEKSN